MLEKLQPERGQRILDVGSGSGWTTALLGHIVGPSGEVIGVERVPELVEQGGKNIERFRFSHVTIKQAGRKIGWPTNIPYDRILVSAGAASVPRALLTQLKNGGIMVIPIKDPLSSAKKPEYYLLVIRKDSAGTIQQEKIGGYEFVPLIHSQKD